MEKNNKTAPEWVKILEEALKSIKKAVERDETEQKTLQDISSRMDKIEQSLQKIKEAIG